MLHRDRDLDFAIAASTPQLCVVSPRTNFEYSVLALVASPNRWPETLGRYECGSEEATFRTIYYSCQLST